MKTDLANGLILIDNFDLLISTVLIFITGAVSLVLRLHMEARLFYAALRTALQLFLIGYLLKFIFSVQSLWLVLGVSSFMIAFASMSAVRRLTRKLQGMAGMAFVTLFFSSLLTTYVVTGLIIGVEPWHEPRYMIPLLGMILGNGLNGLSLCLNKLLESLSDRKAEIELHLSLGASRWEAAQEAIRDAVRTGLIPIINTMMVVGVVSIPGMMTGQILAGANPVDAVKYQIVVMFMVAAATSLGCILISLLVYYRVFNSNHQLLAHRIKTR